jgi:hypothetical protein
VALLPSHNALAGLNSPRISDLPRSAKTERCWSPGASCLTCVFGGRADVRRPISMRMRQHFGMVATSRTLCVLLVGGTSGGCNQGATYALSPCPGVSVAATAKSVSHHDWPRTPPTTSVHVGYAVTNRSEAPIYFKVETVSLGISGRKSGSSYYDTVATVFPQWQLVPKGESDIALYAVFPGVVDAASLRRLTFLNAGFSCGIPK